MRLVAGALLAFALVPQGQAPTGSISGTVLSTLANAPVGGAVMVVAKVGGPASEYRVADADRAGHFIVRGLAAGSYRVYAEQEGFVRGEYGRRVAGAAGIPLTIIEGQAAAGITVTLTPLGAITGRILDRGRPAPRVIVRALKPNYFDGRRSLRIAAYAESDDRGDYRLFGLEPGSYFVMAQPAPKSRIAGDTQVTPQMPTNANGNRYEVVVPLSPDKLDPDALDLNVYPPVYHPGTADLGAAIGVDLKPGSVTAGVNLMIVRALPHAVRGQVAMPSADTQMPRVRVSLARVDEDGSVVPSVESMSGGFELNGVAPGRYFVTAQSDVNTAGAPRLVAVAEIEVGDRDLDGVALMLQSGVNVTGRVTIDGRAMTATDPRVSVQLLTNQPIVGYSAVPVQPDGTFTVASVVPGTYRMRVIAGGRTPWIKSARFGIDDALDAGIRIDGPPNGRELEIAIGTGTATLDAVVLDDARRPVVGALVVAVPDAARRNRSALFRAATTDAQGRVHLENVDPGDYRLFATTEIEANAWQDPALLRRLETRGEPVKLAERGTATVTLKVLQ